MKNNSNKNYEEIIQELKETYNDIRWIEKRNEILNRDEYRCQVCKSGKSLEVHHTYYENKQAWDYPSESLITLCRSCHKETHKIRTVIKDYSGKHTVGILETIDWGRKFCGQKSEKGYNSLPWAEKIRKIILRDLNRCQICESTKSLEVHHKYYSVGILPYNYPDESLISLCSSCHEEADNLKKELNDFEGEFHIGILQELQGAKDYYNSHITP